MTDARVSRGHVEALVTPAPDGRVSRAHADVLVEPAPDEQVSYAAVEVLVLEGISTELAATLPAFTAAAEGTVRPPGRGGDFTLSLPRFTGTTTGTVKPPPRSGTVDLGLPSFTVTADGTFVPLRTGSLAATMAPFAVEITGDDGAPDDAFSMRMLAFGAELDGYVQPITGTDTTYGNEGYSYTGDALADIDPAVQPVPPRVTRADVRRVHAHMPALDLVNGRPR